MTDTTPLYDLPYPEETDHVIDGDNAMQALAEAVEAALLPPVVILGPGDAANLDGDGRQQWNTGAPTRIRGDWTFPAGGRLIIPPTSGLYLVSANFNWVPAGGSSGGTVAPTVRLQHRVSGSDQSTATTFKSVRLPTMPQDETALYELAGLVWIDDTANRGIQLGVIGTVLPFDDTSSGARLQIVRLSRV